MRMNGAHVCALIGLAVGATLLGWSNADALLCVTKNKKGAVTKVTIRGDACKGKESVGDPNVLLGLPTTTTTLPPSAGPRIVDSAGNDVGWLSQVPGFGIVALRTIADQAMAVPMSSVGPSFSAGSSIFDDFQYQFVHQGAQCVGDRFSLENSANAIIAGDLLKFVLPAADRQTGYLLTSDKTDVSTGSYSRAAFVYKCATPPDTTPPTVSCDDIEPAPDPGDAVAPVGQAASCHPSSLLPTDPTIPCTCIRCCVTHAIQQGDPAVSLYRVQAVDLGLGKVTPPFKIKP